jgi:hypothetical protein
VVVVLMPESGSGWRGVVSSAIVSHPCRDARRRRRRCRLKRAQRRVVGRRVRDGASARGEGAGPVGTRARVVVVLQVRCDEGSAA